MIVDVKIFIGIIAIIVGVFSYVPYIRDMHRGVTKPHAFSWLIWTIIAFIAGSAQLSSGGGFGSFVAFATGLVSLYITYYSLRKRAISITRLDWLNLATSLFALPIWILTNNPLYSVIIISLIDLVAFSITIRKTYHLPYSENLTQNIMSTLKHVLTLFALYEYNLTTVLFPASIAVTTLGFTLMIIVRRRIVPNSHKKVRKNDLTPII